VLKPRAGAARPAGVPAVTIRSRTAIRAASFVKAARGGIFRRENMNADNMPVLGRRRNRFLPMK